MGGRRRSVVMGVNNMSEDTRKASLQRQFSSSAHIILQNIIS